MFTVMKLIRRMWRAFLLTSIFVLMLWFWMFHQKLMAFIEMFTNIGSGFLKAISRSLKLFASKRNWSITDFLWMLHLFAKQDCQLKDKIIWPEEAFFQNRWNSVLFCGHFGSSLELLFEKNFKYLIFWHQDLSFEEFCSTLTKTVRNFLNCLNPFRFDRNDIYFIFFYCSIM